MKDANHLALVRSVLVFFACIYCVPAGSEPNVLERVTLSGGIHVELPRNWTTLDEALTDDLNLSSEILVDAAGVSRPRAPNEVLIAKNRYDERGKTIATARVSLRAERGPTQADIRSLVGTPKAELAPIFRPAIDATVKTMQSIGGVTQARAVDWGIVSNRKLTCLHFEFHTTWWDKPAMRSLTWVCPLGERALKLTSSFPETQASVYRPITRAIWNSLAIH
jgi:hypothetical protein